MLIPENFSEPFTDYSRWRLVLGDGGRHTWRYLASPEESKRWPQTDIDRYWLGIKTEAPELPKARTPLEAAYNGYKFLQRLQAPDGHYAGEYGGPMFLLPGVVIAMHICGVPLKHEERLEMIRYLLNRAHPVDGGWGIHVEGHSTVLGTGLNYVAMRLLGVDAEHPALVKARATLHRLGGAAAIPSWGKFWLTVLNVYDWDGNNPVPPELWLLPEWMPIHPWRWWIHTRVVYLPMSYLYRVKFQGELSPIALALREELYITPYDSIDWPAQRNNVAEVDVYAPHTLLLDLLNATMSMTLESCPFPPLQRAALKRAYELICREDENTEYQDIAPVSKMMQMICRFHAEGPESDAVRRHVEKIADFMWLGHEGMMVTGTNGSQVWDAGFISQGLVETGLADLEENRESAMRMLDWLDKAQMTEDPKHPQYRQSTKGAWGFSTKEQGYTLSDCTGEALKSVLYMQNRWPDSPKPVSDERIFDAVNLMISLQNSDGGFAAYELIRGPSLLEAINPAEVFGNIMIEYNYPECTTSVITALSIFQKYYPEYRKADIKKVLQGAIKFLHSAQKPEGGWYGSWGICFNYATMFALESLALAGETYANSESVRRACHFLVDHQMEDGGWGESFTSCTTKKYVHHEKSQVVGTSWAIMALMYAEYPSRAPIERGVKLVMDRQLPNGEWAQEAIEGVFNHNVTIVYPNFKLTFTWWMLGKADKYLQNPLLQ